MKIQLKAVSDQGGKDTYVDLFSIAEASTTPLPYLNFESAYFGSGAIGGSYDVFGDVFTLTNNSGGTLEINSITDLTDEDFATNFDGSITLPSFESYSFSFTYEPTAAEHDSVSFQIDTNGGVVAIDLTGDGYQLEDGMVEIGIGADVATHLPISLVSRYSYTQSIFLQSEIETPDQSISSIYYYYDGSEAEKEITIFMGQVAADTLSDWIPLSEFTEVFQGEISLSEQLGWLEIPLTFPFAYNNSENLVIAVDNNTGGTNYSSNFHSTNGSQNMSVVYRNYSNNPDPENPPTIGTGWSDAKLSTFRPNIRMKFEDTLASANAFMNMNSAYYGTIETNSFINSLGDVFTLMNNGPSQLNITSITDLQGSSFTTNFDMSTSLAFGEAYDFGFIFNPQDSGFVSQEFEIVTNGGTVVVTLSGDSYYLPENIEEIGTGAIINSCLPVEPGNYYSYTQTLYPADELENSLSQIGKLLYHFNGNDSWSENIVVYIGHTTESSLLDWKPISEMTEVFNGYLTTNDVDEWVEVVLQNSFNYNGVDNIIVAIDKNAEMNAGGDFFSSERSENLSIYYVNNSNNPDPENPPVIGTGYNDAKFSNEIPNIRIEFQEELVAPLVMLNRNYAYYDYIMVGDSSDPWGESFTLYNAGSDILTVGSVTSLDDTDFTTTFNLDDVSLVQGESYSFGFNYLPTVGEHDSLYFSIETNGGNVAINLTGDAYALPEGMVEIGAEESSNKYLPYDHYSGFSYTQTLYLQEEINLADQQINQISYFYNGNSQYTDDIVIYMGHTSETTLSSWIPLSELTMVYNSTIIGTGEAGWMEISLQLPFTYNNSDNLVIAIDENSAGNNYGNYAYCTESAENMSVYYKHYSNDVDPNDPPAVTNSWGGGYSSTFRPNIRMQFAELLIAPSLNLSRTDGYYGYMEVGVSSDPFGDAYQFTGGEIEIGTDSLFTFALPVVLSSQYSYFQSLYKQSELSLDGNQITQIYYHFNGASAFTDEVSLYMGHTSRDTLNNWIPNSELVQVYNGDMETHFGDSWVRDRVLKVV